jgi:predicted SprT family Zn-dependent metalloprotease
MKNAFTPDELLSHAVFFSNSTWEGFCEIYPKLNKLAPPTVKLDNRLKTTAGYAHYEEWFTRYSVELFSENFAEFASWTFPHEIGHLVAFRLYKATGHCIKWQEVMRKYCDKFGGEYSRCHPFLTNRMRARIERKLRDRIE